MRKIPYRYDSGWAVTRALSSGNFELWEVDSGRGQGASDGRWKAVAVEPLWVTGDRKLPLMAGALTSASAILNKKVAKPWYESMDRLARRWEKFLGEFL